jgi:DNA-binding HxlR family transcriptional regulator
MDPFCPTAKAAEILAERWTLRVLRDILVFQALQRLASRHAANLADAAV